MGTLRRLIAARRENPLLAAVSLAVLATLLAQPFLDVLLRDVYGVEWVQEFHFNDWVPYATAVVRWQSGQVVYWQNSGGGYFGTYLYPPVYVLLMLPWFELGLLDVFGTLGFPAHNADVSAILFETFSVGALWVGLQAVAAEFDADLSAVDRAVLLWALVGFYPLLFSLKLGQVSALVAAGFCVVYVAMEQAARPDAGRGLALLSGALTTVTAGIKPYYATGGAHLLRNRDRFLGAVAGGVALALLSVGAFGVQNHVAYLDVLTWGKGWAEPPRALYLWHPGYYEPFFVLGRLSTTLAVLVRVALLLGVVGLALLARRADVRAETFALGLALYSLVAPEVYTQDFVALLVVAVVLADVELRAGGYPWLVVLAVGLLHAHAYALRLMAFPPDWLPLGGALTTAAPALQPGVWGNLLLFGLAAYRVARPVEWRPLPVSLPGWTRS